MMSDVIPAALERPQPMAFLSGPSFAKDLLQEMPTGFSVASHDDALALQVKDLFSNRHIRLYPTHDVIGVEVGGALKNVFAIAAGVVEGLGLGANTTAMLVTLGCREMNRLAQAMGSQPDTLK